MEAQVKSNQGLEKIRSEYSYLISLSYQTPANRLRAQGEL